MNLLKKFIFLFIVSTFIILSLYFTTGFYFETGSDVYVNLIQKGVFTAYGEGVLNNYGIYILLTHLFAKLQFLIPQLDWLNSFILLALVTITTNLFYFGFHILKVSNIFLKVLFALSVILLGIGSVYSIETARTSSLLTGSSILILLHLFKEDKLNITSYLFFFGVSMMGLLIRIESGVLIMALFFPVYFLISSKKINFLKLLIPYFIGISLLAIFLNTPLSRGDKSYAALRPYQFNLWDYGLNNIAISQLEEKDALIYKTASNFFFADPAYIKPSFFEKIGIEKADKTPFGIMKLLKHMNIQKFFDFCKKNRLQLIPLLAVYGCFIFYLLLFSKKPRSVLIITIYSVLIVVMVASLMKMEMRIFHPILILTLMLILTAVEINHFKVLRLKKLSYFYVALLFVFTSVVVGHNASNFVSQKQKFSKQISEIKAVVNEIEDNSLIIVNLMVFINWEQKLSVKPKQYPYSNLLVLDNFLLFLQESQQTHLKNIAGFDSFNGFMGYLASNTEKKLFLVSSQQRKALIDEYLAGIYTIELVDKNIYTSKEDTGLPFVFTIDEVQFRNH